MSRSNSLATALLLVMSLGIAGCSVIGYTMGAADDRRAPKTSTVPPEKWKALAPDAAVTLRLADSTTVAGSFVDARNDVIRIRHDGRLVEIPQDRITELQVPRHGSSAARGFAIGLAIDAVWITLTYLALSQQTD